MKGMLNKNNFECIYKPTPKCPNCGKYLIERMGYRYECTNCQAIYKDKY